MKYTKEFKPISRVIFICELLDRDFKSRFELASNLKKRYPLLDVCIVEQEFCRCIHGSFFSESIVYDKSASNNSSRIKFFKKIKKNNGILLVEDEESLAIYTNPQNYLSIRVSSSTLSLIDRFVCWSEFQKKTIDEKYPSTSSKTKSIGSSRYLMFRDAPVAKKRADYVLFNSNFSLLSNFRTPEELIEFRKKNMQIETDLDWAQSLFVSVENNFTIFCSAINYVLGMGHVVKIRPHPSEKKERLMQLLREFGVEENLLIERDLVEAIAEAKILIHANCGSCIEASIIGIPSLNIALSVDDHLKNIGFSGDISSIGKCLIQQVSSNSEELVGEFFDLSAVFAGYDFVKKSKNWTVDRMLLWLALAVFRYKEIRNLLFHRKRFAKLNDKWDCDKVKYLDHTHPVRTLYNRIFLFKD